jgi:hypothetical protein
MNKIFLERSANEGESPVKYSWHYIKVLVRYTFKESDCLGVQSKVGGKILLKLNIDQKPIANKYRKGNLKRTSSRSSKNMKSAHREP